MTLQHTVGSRLQWQLVLRQSLEDKQRPGKVPGRIQEALEVSTIQSNDDTEVDNVASSRVSPRALLARECKRLNPASSYTSSCRCSTHQDHACYGNRSLGKAWKTCRARAKGLGITRCREVVDNPKKLQ